MDNLITVAFILLGIPTVIGGIWSYILMWRYSKVVFLLSLLIPIVPIAYFYFKCWSDKNVRLALYLQIPFLLSLLILLIFSNS